MELCSDLSGVKAGDTLLVNSSHSWSRIRVARVTFQQVVIGEGHSAMRYRKKDGRRVGDSGIYSYAYAYLYDEAGKAKWNKMVALSHERDLRSFIRNADWSKVPYSDLFDIASVLLSLDAFGDDKKTAVHDLLSVSAKQREEHNFDA